MGSPLRPMARASSKKAARSSISREICSICWVSRDLGSETAAAGSSVSPRRFRHSRSTRASSSACALLSEGSVVLPSVISSGRALPPPNCAISCKRAFSASVEEPLTRGGRYAALRMDMSSRISSICAVLRLRATKSIGLYVGRAYFLRHGSTVDAFSRR